MLAAFDAVAGPLSSVIFREKRTPAAGKVKKILVLELWHMGDVVLATPALQKLRMLFPDARITLLAKQHARELLQHSPLVDEIVTFDFPWTAMSGKYDPSRYDTSSIREVVRRLRSMEFDLSIDCRMDLRSNLLTRSIGARRRVGYDFGGGGFLLTDAVSAPPADQHKIEDWMALLEPLEKNSSRGTSAVAPSLTVTDEERADARRVLEHYDMSGSDSVVGVHPGGSHEAKRWPADNFAAVARALADRQGVKLLVFVDPEGCGSDMQLGPDAAFVRTSIREMMALFTQCKLVICNDSGPMHIATALGVPVVAVFRTGDPKAYGPRGLFHTVVGEGLVSGRVSDVAVEDVLAAAEASLSARGID